MGKAIALIALAAVLTGGAALLALWKFDDSSGPADRISLALTTANIAYTAMIIFFSFRAKALAKFIGIYFRIQSGNRTGPSASIFIKTLDQKVVQYANEIRYISDGRIEKNNPNHFEFTEDLYAGSSKHIDAISRINPEAYWMSPQTSQRASDAQLKAKKRGVRIRRTFIFDDYATAIAFYSVMHAQKKIGVEVSYAILDEIEEQLREKFNLLDFSIYDEKCVQMFEFSDEHRRTYSRCQVSTLAETITEARELFSILTDYQISLPDQREKMKGFQELTTRSTATNRTTEAYYGNSRSPAPDLKLNLLTGLQKKISVLDVGCGGGRMVMTFMEAFDCIYTGIDKDPVAIQSCRAMFSKNARANFKKGGFLENSKEFSEESFDIVIAYNSIYHANRDDFFLAIDEIKRTLKRDGYFLLTIKTVSGNERAMMPRPGYSRIKVDDHNSYIHCNFPDHGNIHHFCTDEEIQDIKSKFSLIYEEHSSAKIDPQSGELIHGAGLYLILKRT